MTIALNLQDLKMTGPADHTWIVSYRWNMTAPFGPTQTEMCVEMPNLVDQAKATRTLGPWLWTFLIAPAISTLVVLDTVESIVWNKALIANVDAPPIEMRGQHFGLGTDRDDSGQWVLDAGAEKRWNRRVFLPAMPRAWQRDGLLTRSGWENLVEYARAAYMGLQPIYPNPLATWYNAYPGVVPPTLENPLGVGFKPVKEVRVCWHTDKAPLPSGEVWP